MFGIVAVFLLALENIHSVVTWNVEMTSPATLFSSYLLGQTPAVKDKILTSTGTFIATEPERVYIWTSIVLNPSS